MDEEKVVKQGPDVYVKVAVTLSVIACAGLIAVFALLPAALNKEPEPHEHKHNHPLHQPVPTPMPQSQDSAFLPVRVVDEILKEQDEKHAEENERYERKVAACLHKADYDTQKHGTSLREWYHTIGVEAGCAEPSFRISR